MSVGVGGALEVHILYSQLCWLSTVKTYSIGRQLSLDEVHHLLSIRVLIIDLGDRCE